MVTSLSLAILATRNAGTSTSVLERQKGTTQQKGATTPAAPAPVAPTQPAPAAPKGQPRIELIPEGSDKPVQTIPLDINKLPKVNPNQAKPNPAPPPAPAK
jgi:hypothetical protein